MMSLHNVTKTYPIHGGLHMVLDNINLELPAGHSVGIVGRNGAGKSTLLRILSGVEKPDVGTITKTGKVSWPIGFSGGFSGSLTGEENCRFVARVYRQDPDWVVGFAEDFAEIGKYFQMPVRTYSSGMRARLAFGLSMAVDFDYYLVDEVTAVGDKNFQEKCRAAFEARRERASVIMVSHSMGTIRSYCDSAAVLHRGRLTHYETVALAERAYGKLS